MSKTVPTSFNDLDAPELYRSAIEDFALPVEEADKGKKKVLVAAFVEGGVSWADYVAQHPEVAPEPEPEPVNVIKAPNKKKAGRPQAGGNVITAKPIDATEEEQYLIKMTRENPLYETRGYRFTQEHPYALVSAADAQFILEREDGFRQAFPNELQEFYG